MTEPSSPLVLALVLLRLLRRPLVHTGRLALRGDTFTLDDLPVPTGAPLDRPLAEALYAAQMQILELPACSPENLLAPIRDGCPRTLGDTLARLHDVHLGAGRWRLAPAIQRLLVRAGASRDELDHGLPAGFIAWLESVACDDRWRYADAPPLPGARPLPLDRTWVELCIIEAEELFSLRQNRPLRRDEMAWRTEPTAWILERISGPTIVLGDPGAGKTTLLRWIARRSVTTSEGRAFMPLFVSLRRFADALTADWTRSLVEHFVRCECDDDLATNVWLRQLRPGRGSEGILGLLDGWDEVPTAMRDAVAAAIADFTARFPFTVITSRNSGAPDRLGYEKLFTLTELGAAGVENLVRNWCQESGCPRMADEFLSDLDRHEDVARMARNPFLLTLLCTLSTAARDAILPRSRAELYRRTLALLRDSSPRPISGPQEQAIEAFALWLMRDATDAPRYDFQPDEVATVTRDATLFERVLLPSRLIKQPHVRQPYHAFLHATFQEFLAARALARPGQALAEHLRIRGVSGPWREVFRFVAASQPRDAEVWWSVLRRAASDLDRHGVLAVQLAELVAEIGVIDGGRGLLGIDLREVLWAHITRSSSPGPCLDAHRRLDAADLVARIEGELQRDGCRERRRAELVRMLGKLPAPEASRVLVKIALASEANLAAVARNAAGGVLTAADRRLLRAELRDPSQPLARTRSVIEILGHARDATVVEILAGPLWDRKELRPTIVGALRTIASEDAIAALNRWLVAAPPTEVPSLLRALAQARAPHARDTLVAYLIHVADHGADDEALVRILGELAELPLHRGTVVIRHLLAAHPNAEVRQAAAWALAESSEQGTVEVLVVAVDHDPDPNVRGAALGALRTRVTPTHAEWLLDKFTTASEDQTRSDAVTALLLLAERSLDGSDGYRLQSMAAHAIVQGLAERRGDVALAAATHGFAGGIAVAGDLLAAAQDERASSEVRELAILSLGRLGHREAVATMVEFIDGAADTGDDDAAPDCEDAARRARRAAEALALVDPLRLSAIPGALAEDALAQEAHRRQWLVYEDGVHLSWRAAEPVAPTAAARLVIRWASNLVTFGDQPLVLTPAMRATLTRLAKSAGKCVGRLELIQSYDRDYKIRDPKKQSQVVRQRIKELRKRLQDLGDAAAGLGGLIDPVGGVGYRLALTPDRVDVRDD